MMAVEPDSECKEMLNQDALTEFVKRGRVVAEHHE